MGREYWNCTHEETRTYPLMNICKNVKKLIVLLMQRLGFIIGVNEQLPYLLLFPSETSAENINVREHAL